MADSNITKKALAASLKELMTEQSFEKINVTQICERCDMNRKSFYYHFKDKYDLINWIFDTEFMALVKDEDLHADYGKHWALVEKACDYFYENHAFYRKALQIKGQNSFSDHFREYIRPLLQNRLSYIFGQGNVDEFVLGFFADAVLCAMERWLLARNCIPSREFVERIKDLTEKCVTTIYREIAEPQQPAPEEAEK